jgi:hypothetical protein
MPLIYPVGGIFSGLSYVLVGRLLLFWHARG